LDNLGDIVTFVRVVGAGSFVAAANHLAVTPSAVSKSISRLEERLGARLLNRTTRSLSLTDVGSEFYQRCQALVTQLQDAEAEVVETRQRPRGRLRVDMPLALGREYVIPALPRFLAQYPDVTVQVSMTDRLIDMVNEGVDVVLRVGELTDSRLNARRLGPAGQVVLVASPDYLARAGTPTDPDDLLKHSCVRFFNPNTGKVFDWAFNREGERKVVPVTGRLLMSDIGSMTAAAVAGAGIAPAIQFLAERPIAAGLLTPVLPDWELEGQRPVSALYLKGKHPSPKVQAFIDFLVTLFPTPDGRTHPRPTR
jgi:LysR family transcriptional regulator, regulator for bpeEF and oprC